MDVADDHKDAKLYRASGDLLQELIAKLPSAIRHPKGAKRAGQIRQLVLDSKTEEIIQLLGPFQEWPQLLDTHLAVLVEFLAGAFLSYVSTCGEHYARPSGASINASPLPRAISKILYVICKIRGQKVVVRLLNNEAKYIEPLLNFMARWRKPFGSQPENPGIVMSWEEGYILMLWLSHLMLTPFDLFSISSVEVTGVSHDVADVSQGLPTLAISLLSVALESLYVSSKERDAASALIVRLVLRPDMQAHRSLDRIIAYALRSLQEDSNASTISAYSHVGNLSIIFGIFSTGSDADVAPFLLEVFRVCLEFATGDAPQQLVVRNLASSRKLLVKIMRSALIHAISLVSKTSQYLIEDQVDTMLEQAIQSLLDALGDKDTPVRMAASKNLSMIAVKLDSHMAAEVVQAVLDSLNENILLQKLETGVILAATDSAELHSTNYCKDVSAVDPLRWHGLMLTLGHLLFRRSPPAYQLPALIEALILGLNFEQRSNVGNSIGVGVRDAACFGLWSLARKYSTQELSSVESSSIAHLAPHLLLTNDPGTALQRIAVELVISASCDPSGNIRRGSSAALQELIGRHPESITAGIPLVQTVDYHAVARHSRAVCEVAVAAGRLDTIYNLSLLNALVDWRGAKAADREARQSAASAVGILANLLSDGQLESLCKGVIDRLVNIKPSNLGATAEMRHGLLLMLSSIFSSQLSHGYTTEMNGSRGRAIATFKGETSSHIRILSSVASKVWKQIRQVAGDVNGRITRDLELVLEAVASLIDSLASFGNEYTVHGVQDTNKGPVEKEQLRTAIDMIERCVTASEKDYLVYASSQAALALFNMLESDAKLALVRSWTDPQQRRRLETSCKGRIQSLGLFYASAYGSSCARDITTAILEYQKDLVQSPWPIETRSNVMASLAEVVVTKDLGIDIVKDLFPLIIAGLTDYTVDQRGDVGSTLRLKSIVVVESIFSHSDAVSGLPLRCLIQELVKLALEKLSKVRFRAWACLKRYWKSVITFPVLKGEFGHPQDVSSSLYYENLLQLLHIDWLQRPLILGLISSVAAGTEDIGRASCNALVTHFLRRSVDEQTQLSLAIHDVLVEHLQASTVQVDRDVVPALELLEFCLEQGLLSQHHLSRSDSDKVEIWTAIETIRTPAASILRLEKIVGLYSALCYFDVYRRRALDKLTRMLLHRFPKIRNQVADVLFLHTQIDSLLVCDWTAQTAGLKPLVNRIRKDLGVVAITSTTRAQA